MGKKKKRHDIPFLINKDNFPDCSHDGYSVVHWSAIPHETSSCCERLALCLGRQMVMHVVHGSWSGHQVNKFG